MEHQAELFSTKTKVCTRCKVEKPVSCFTKKSKSSDGLDWWCVECKRTHHIQNYRRKNEMTKSRFNQLFSGQSSIAKKVYECLPDNTYWTPSRVQNELFSKGSKISLHEVSGCLNSLLRAGLVNEAGDAFAKEPVREHERNSKANESYADTKPAPANEVEKKSPIDRLLGISIKLGELSQMISTISKEIDGVVDEVERTMNEESEETKKLKQLRELLNSIK